MAIEVAKLFVKVGADITDMLNGMKQADQSLKQTGNSMSMVGMGLSAAITLPLVGIGTMAVKAGMEFETAMNVMQNNSGATSAEFAKLSDLAIKLGADVKLPGTSAKDAAEAMNELAKNGISVTDIMSSMRPVLEMAAAGNMDNAEAAKLAAQAMNIFGLEGTDMKRITDLFAGAAKESSLDIKDMSYGMSQAGFAFSAAKMPIEDLATTMTILSKNGLEASDGATAVKNAIMRMMSPTGKAIDEMKKFGVSFYDANNQMKPMKGIVDNLNSSLGGLSDEERNAALETIFMSDGMKAMIPLMKAGVEGWEDTGKAISEEGLAAGQAEARNKGLQGAMDALQSSVETAYLRIKDALDPTIRQLAEAITGLVNGFTDLDPAMQRTIIGIGLAAAAAGPLLIVAGQLVVAWAAVGPMIAGAAAAAASAVASLTVEIGLLASGVSIMEVAALGGFTAIAVAAAPIVIVTALIVGLTAGTLLYADAQNKAAAAAEKSAKAMVKGGMELDDVYKELIDKRNPLITSQADVAMAVAKSAKSYEELKWAVRDVDLTVQGAGMASTSHETVTKAIWKTVEAERALKEASDKAIVGRFDSSDMEKYTGKMTENFRLSTEAATGAAAAIDKVTSALDAEIAKELLDIGMKGEMGDIYDTYTGKMADLTQAHAELIAKKTELLAKYAPESSKILDINGKLEENKQKQLGAAAAMKEATAQMIFQLAAAKLDAGAALELAKGMGLIDEASYAVARAMQATVVAYDLNKDGSIDATEANAGFKDAVLKLNGAVDGLHDKGVAVTMNSLQPYMTELDTLKAKKDGLTNKDVIVAVDGTQAFRTIDTMQSMLSGIKDKTVTITTRYVDEHGQRDPETTPGRASGGSVLGGSSYIVGERGPELFVPKTNGTIMPNDAFGNVVSGKSGGTTINLGGITINGNADASVVRQAAKDGVMAAARSMGAR